MNERIKELAAQCWDRRLDGVHFDQEKFAALVAAHEREECAKIAETPFSGEQDDITMQAKDRVTAAIRARGREMTYISKSPRPWVGLTNEEIEVFIAHLYPLPEKPVRERLRVLLTKLRERNT